MKSYIVIEQVDLTLSAGQRTALGLGSIGSDPRNAALRYSMIVCSDSGESCAGSTFFYPWERAAMTRAQLRDAVIADARARLATYRNASDPEGFGVGARLVIE